MTYGRVILKRAAARTKNLIFKRELTCWLTELYNSEHCYTRTLYNWQDFIGTKRTVIS